LSKFFTHDDNTWASNMNPKIILIHIFCERLPSITKKGEI